MTDDVYSLIDCASIWNLRGYVIDIGTWEVNIQLEQAVGL